VNLGITCARHGINYLFNQKLHAMKKTIKQLKGDPSVQKLDKGTMKKKKGGLRRLFEEIIKRKFSKRP